MAWCVCMSQCTKQARVFEQEKNECTWKEWLKVRAVLDTGEGSSISQSRNGHSSKIKIPFTPSTDFFPLVVWKVPESCSGGAGCCSAVQEVAEPALGQQFSNRCCAGVRVQALGVAWLRSLGCAGLWTPARGACGLTTAVTCWWIDRGFAAWVYGSSRFWHFKLPSLIERTEVRHRRHEALFLIRMICLSFLPVKVVGLLLGNQVDVGGCLLDWG